MDLVLLVLLIACVGFLLYFITTRIPMDPIVRVILQIVVIVVLVLFLLRRFGGLPNFL